MAEQRSGENLRDEKDQKVGDAEVTIDTNKVDKRREGGDWKGKKVAKRIKRLREGEDVEEQENIDSVVNTYIRFFPELPPLKRGTYSCFGIPHNENVKDQEFGRSTNRNDYFAVSPWGLDIEKDHHSLTSDNSGGGMTRQVPPTDASNDGGEVSDKRLNPETGGSNTERSHNASELKVIVLEQKVSSMQKEQQAREEELQAQLEIERKHVAELQAQQAELAAKMAEHARFSEQFSAFMRQHQPGLQPESLPPSN